MNNKYKIKTVDIVKLEEIKKWCEYRPLIFITNKSIQKEKLDNFDIFLKNFIEHFYYKFNIQDKDKNNHSFKIKITNKDDFNFYRWFKYLINKFNIELEAKYKLTTLELNYCHNISLNAKISNIEDLLKIDNFYIKSYAKYLIFNSPKWKSTTKVKQIRKTI